MPDKIPTAEEMVRKANAILRMREFSEEERRELVDLQSAWRDAIRREQRRRSARLVAVWAARDTMGVPQPTLAEMILHDKED